MDIIHRFYCSKEWRELSFRLKVERGFRCERSGIVFTDTSELIAHHKIELTEENIHDPNITLNPDNIEIISVAEHNKEHRRFGYSQKSVYIVYGSPLSGKTTMVKDIMKPGDIAVDMDAIWKCLTLTDTFEKPNQLKLNVFRTHDLIIDQIKVMYGNWINAYIIGGYPNKIDRERITNKLKAEQIYCESTKDECLKRLYESGRPLVWEEYIEAWWEEYTA